MEQGSNSDIAPAAAAQEGMPSHVGTEPGEQPLAPRQTRAVQEQRPGPDGSQHRESGEQVTEQAAGNVSGGSRQPRRWSQRTDVTA